MSRAIRFLLVTAAFSLGCLVAGMAYAQNLATDFDNWVMRRPLSTTTLGAVDSIPIIQGGETRRLFPQSFFMRPDGSNATLPGARTAILPTPTLDNCLVGTGTDWVSGTCGALPSPLPAPIGIASVTGCATFADLSGAAGYVGLQMDAACSLGGVSLDRYFLTSNTLGGERVINAPTAGVVYFRIGNNTKMYLHTWDIQGFLPFENSESIRSTGQSVAPAAAGAGVEVRWTGSTASLLGYNRTTSAYVPVSVEGSSLTLALNGGNATLTGGGTLTGLPIPTAASDAVTKGYADSIAAGIVTHAAVAAGTTANLTATASGTGPGKTLTNSGAQAAFATDGYNGLLNDRILVKNQTLSQNNGIYTLTTVGTGATNWVLTRATDFDAALAAEVAAGASVIVINGTTLMATNWVETGQGPFTLETTPIVFSQVIGGSSGGTINAGTTNQLGYYAANGTTISGLTTGNNGVLATNGSGVPSITSTLPNGIALGAATATTINKLALTAPATGSTLTVVDGKAFIVNKSLTLEGTDGTVWTGPTTSKTLAANDYSNLTTLTANALLTGGGAATAPNAVVLTGLVKGNGASAPAAYAGTSCTNQFPRSLDLNGAATCASVASTDLAAGIPLNTFAGTATNDNATAGRIGEYVTGSATAVALTTTTQTNITSISLTAGDWDVTASVQLNPAATTTSTVRAAGVTTTSATMPTTLAVATAASRVTGAITAGQGRHVLNTAPARQSLAGTTTVYCVAQATFATSTMTADCLLRARRVR